MHSGGSVTDTCIDQALSALVASFFQNGARGFQRIHDELAGGRSGHGSCDNSSDSNERQVIQKLLLNAIAGLLASLA